MQPRCQLNIEPTYILIHILVAPSMSHNLHMFWSLWTFIFIAVGRQFPFIYSIDFNTTLDADLLLMTLRVKKIFVTTYNYSVFCILKQKHVCTVLKRNQNNKNEISMMTLSKEKRDGDLDDLYRWLKSCRLLSGVSQSQRSVRIVTSALAAGLTWSVLQTVQVMICWTFWYSLCSMNFTARKKYILKKQHTSRLI